MNQCRLKILVSEEVMGASGNDDGLVGKSAFVKQYDADATLRHVRDDFIDTIKGSFSIWDCTLHPPKDISDWLFEKWPNRSGPRAKTLFSAGCFPSALWQVTPKGVEPYLRSAAEDSQYNQRTSIREDTVLTSKVELLDQPMNVKPSQVLNHVKERFGDDRVEEETVEAILARKSNLRERKLKEESYHAGLEERIRNLDGIKGNTSKKVKKMLIKSRCTGIKSLKMQDRVYLHIGVVGKGYAKEHFRYFSRQDTVARLIQTLSENNDPSQEVEVLVSVSPKTYRSMPLLFRLYEAIEKNVLEEVDSIVLRYFTPPNEHPTTSIFEDISAATITTGTDTHNDDITSTNHQEGILSDGGHMSILPKDLVQKFNDAIATIDKKSKTKRSTTVKVREMMMKSKSKGDTKRTKKLEDRFFVEFIVLNMQGDVSSSYVFMSKTDTVRRLLEEHMQESCAAYAINGESIYVEVSHESVLQELQRDDVLNCFGRLLIIRS